MKKTVVDYRGLRLHNITSPQYNHLLLMLGWVGYFALYFLTENLIPAENCTPVHIWLDDLIPFCEWFVIPYVGWYVLIVVSLGWFALYNVKNFRRLQTFIIVTQVVAMIIYILWPSRQDLRPEVFPRENFLTDILGLIYAFDTSTGVCPSLHAAYSIGIASVWLKEPEASRGVKLFVALFCFVICISIAFVKQHSIADFFAAIPVCLLAEYIACKDWWKERRKT